MRRKTRRLGGAERDQGRVLARVLSEDLRKARGLGEEPPPVSQLVVTAPPPGWDSSDGISDSDVLG